MGASLYIFFSPVTISGETGTLLCDSSEVVEVFTRQQSWYEAQGLWGLFSSPLRLDIDSDCFQKGCWQDAAGRNNDEIVI